MSAVPPTFAIYREMVSRASRSEAHREAASWALNELEATLGDDWLVRAVASADPPPLLQHLAWMSGHVQAFAEVLEWALRLRLLRDVHGAGDVRRELLRDATAGRTLHTALQLNVAACAQRLGWRVALELKPDAATAPADVVVRTQSAELVVEARVLTEALATRELRAEIHAVHERLWLIGARHDVWIGGSPERVLSENELRSVEAWAAARADDPAAADPWVADGVELRLGLRVGDGEGLRSPPVTDALWPRMAGVIAAKAESMRAAAADWLRIVPLTGLFAFTGWAQEPLGRKLEEMAVGLATEPDSRSPAGVVLSSAASLALGDVDEERVEAGPAVAVRRAIAPVRARETLIVPLRDDAIAAVGDWEALADAESSWLEWALLQVGLPSLGEVLA